MNFDQIKEFAKQSSTPVDRERGVIREFLQSKFISILYGFSKATKLSFVGGTSLRLLRDLPRFSEDLDFDNLGLSGDEIGVLVSDVVKRFDSEGIKTELKTSIKEYKTYFELRFPDLLHQLGISTNPKEKVMIKVDYANLWKGQVTEGVLFNRYGFIASVLTNTMDQLLVQKLTAYAKRPRTQARDLYDIVWLYSQGARLDGAFMVKNNITDVTDIARERLEDEGVTSGLRERLKPFLFGIGELNKLDLVGEVLKKL